MHLWGWTLSFWTDDRFADNLLMQLGPRQLGKIPLFLKKKLFNLQSFKACISDSSRLQYQGQVLLSVAFASTGLIYLSFCRLGTSVSNLKLLKCLDFICVGRLAGPTLQVKFVRCIGAQSRHHPSGGHILLLTLSRSEEHNVSHHFAVSKNKKASWAVGTSPKYSHCK